MAPRVLDGVLRHGTGLGLEQPLRTVSGRVMVEGVEHQIAYIGMRMLQPYELLRAQFGRFAEG